ncbi:MAG: hypothetical protein EZS28_034283 [Streblomastix strix]|uniref:Uncharacterized protein n=1 Tax=Streblomastix strix TaxID=222440 RepID=A0A5J4UJM2_9EUKA|nr:MAG: hypothetical protein EZS28_034283 [Streblomastix strix]
MQAFGQERQIALDNILDEIGTAKIECYRAEQFSGLLDGLIPIIKDATNIEAERVDCIIELLSTKQFVMVNEETNNFITIFKAKDLGNMMKAAFMNNSTPASVKESLAQSISSLGIIADVNDEYFKPILDLLFDRLKSLEEQFVITPYKKDIDPKRNKYGLRTLQSILNALCVYAIGGIEFQKEIANRGGIEIGYQYIQNKSAKTRVIAAYNQ